MMTLDEPAPRKFAPIPARGKSRLRRAGAALLGLAAVTVWLMALPGLLRRDGLLAPDGGCRHGAYRDPVTGRPTLAPRALSVTPAPGVERCLPAFQGARK